MIIDTRDGKTFGDFKPFTHRGRLAAFLADIKPGQKETLEAFIRNDGTNERLTTIQARMNMAKQPGSKYVTRTVPEGIVVIRLN